MLLNESLKFHKIIKFSSFVLKVVICEEAGLYIISQELSELDEHLKLRVLIIKNYQVTIQVYDSDLNIYLLESTWLENRELSSHSLYVNDFISLK